jgi:hypothetical protein
VDELTQQTLALLDEIARGEADPHPVQLSPEYLRDVERVECLPQNQSGRDKSHVERAQRQFLASYRTVTRVR